MNQKFNSQAINQLKTASNILVIPAADPNFDSLGSALAIQSYFSKLDKRVRIVSAVDQTERVRQIFDTAEIENKSLSKNTVIEVDLKKTGLSELSYQKLNDSLRIFLTPTPKGEFSPQDIKVETAVYPFDLIITCGVLTLSELGTLFAEHAQLFYETPVINIDFRAGNENFGQINIVDLTASSVSEVVSDLLTEFDSTSIDEKIATLLLTGIVWATNSFQGKKTSPQVFQKASKLVELGAKQQEIISKLYRSKSLGLLHLWGRVLARLKQDVSIDLVYSALPASDIERSGATASDIAEIIPEMRLQLSFAKNFLFLLEQGNATRAMVFLSDQINTESLFAAYEPQSLGGNIFSFTINKSITEAENEIVGIIRSELAKITG